MFGDTFFVQGPGIGGSRGVATPQTLAEFNISPIWHCTERNELNITLAPRGGELGVLRVREHPLREQVHPLIAKSTLSKQKKMITKHHLKPISNRYLYDNLSINLGKSVKETAKTPGFALK